MALTKRKGLSPILPQIKCFIWGIIGASDMKFTENKTDDVIIGLDEEKCSTTPGMINLIEFIAVTKESVQEAELRHWKRIDQN